LSDWEQSWFLGSRGIHQSVDGIQWEPLGDRPYQINDLVRQPHRLVAAADWGMWEVFPDRPGWVQLHDETLTEILAISPGSGDPGIVAASPYGVALGKRGDHGETHWTARSDGLSVNETFSNALLADPTAPGRLLVGTEAGLLVYTEVDGRWERSSLSGTPCRALCHAHGFFWAGTDDWGVWRSVDGLAWDQAGRGLDDGAVFSLASSEEELVAGTLHGICVGDGVGTWRRRGPRMLVSAVAVHPKRGGPWLAGGTPGGLWYSQDAGDTWRQTGEFNTVRSILPPKGEKGD
jgi:ligand-binding sensor domain-containing protein